MPFWLYSPPVLGLEFSLNWLELFERHWCLAVQLQREMLRPAAEGDEHFEPGTNVLSWNNHWARQPAVIELR